LFLIEFDQNLTDFTMSRSPEMRFDLPLALDLISALVMGSTLPVRRRLANGPLLDLGFLSSGI